MPNRNYVNGANLERKIKKYLEESNFWVIRSAGSHGCADLVALKDDIAIFIQIKKYLVGDAEKNRILLGMANEINFKAKKTHFLVLTDKNYKNVLSELELINYVV